MVLVEFFILNDTIRIVNGFVLFTSARLNDLIFVSVTSHGHVFVFANLQSF